MDERRQALHDWLADELAMGEVILRSASADASFRRYYRLNGAKVSARYGVESVIVMDAPPPQEDCRPFVELSARLCGWGLRAPQVLAQDLEQGFLLLSDLGNQTYLQVLDGATAPGLYADALAALRVMQAAPASELSGLPAYDEALLRREMALFRDWLLEQHLGLDTQQTGLAEVEDLLVESALAQPQAFVHRDYHSRNLMIVAEGNPGILDFQDAVVGPLTYDAVSLLKDCYIAWPRSAVLAYLRGHHVALQEAGLSPPEWQQFLRDFDLMGVQRHLKAAGIFARLNRRDGKPGYMADIPRTLDHIGVLNDDYPELAPLIDIIAQIQPRLAAA